MWRVQNRFIVKSNTFGEESCILQSLEPVTTHPKSCRKLSINQVRTEHLFDVSICFQLSELWGIWGIFTTSIRQPASSIRMMMTMVWVWHVLPRVYQTNLMKPEKQNTHEHERNLWEMDNLLPSPSPTMELDTFFLLTFSISGISI